MMNFQKVLVAIDQSSQAELIFEQALQQVNSANGELLILHTLPLGLSPLWSCSAAGDPVAGAVLWQVQEEELRVVTQKTKEWLKVYQQQAIAHGISTETNLALGAPERQICEVARTWGADLIVVGRRGANWLVELLFGSVSNYVLHHAHCPVLTVQGKAAKTAKLEQTPAFNVPLWV